MSNTASDMWGVLREQLGDKDIQDILFSYEGLAEYNKALKKLRGFYKRSNFLAVNR